MKETLSSSGFAALMSTNYILLHGIPKDMISDRNLRFTADAFSAIAKAWGMDQHMSTSAHPQTDGQTEKLNDVIGTYLKAFAAAHPEDWEDYLPMGEFAYNSFPQLSTQITPFELDLGYQPTIPTDLILRVTGNSARAKEGEEFAVHLQATLTAARDMLAEVQTGQAIQANRKRRAHNFTAGDKVFVNTKDLPLTYANAATSSKTRHRFIGEFTILKIRGNAAKLDMGGLDIHPVVNVSKLRPDYRDLTRLRVALPPLRKIRKQDAGIYEVNRIVDHKRGEDGKMLYRIRYVGYDDGDDEWMDEKGLKNCREILDEYREANNIEKPKRGRPRKIVITENNHGGDGVAATNPIAPSRKPRGRPRKQHPPGSKVVND